MAKQGVMTATPRLRFPEFRQRNPWAVTRLGEVLKVGNGRDYKHLEEGSIPVYGSGGYMLSVDDYLYDGESACIGRKGTIDKPVFLTGKFWTVDTLFYTHSFTNCLPYFVYLHFQQINWLKYNEAGGVPSLSKTNIEKIEVAIPDVTEQQKIADCLTSLDEVIAAQGRKVEALKAHKRGLMQQLFPREGETRPRLRFPEFRNAQEWEWRALSRVCDMQAGRFVSASEISEQPGEGRFPCYGGNGLRGYTETFTHSGEFPLIGRQGALCGNVQFAQGEFHATEHAVVASSKNGVNVVWLYYVLEMLELNRYATGQAQPGLSVDVLRTVQCPTPKTEIEQQRIADCLSSLDTRIAAESTQLAALKTYKQGLMQQLFPAPEASGT